MNLTNCSDEKALYWEGNEEMSWQGCSYDQYLDAHVEYEKVKHLQQQGMSKFQKFQNFYSK